MKNKDFEIAKEDFDTSYAKILKKDSKRRAAFKKRIIADFNKTHNLPVFLMNLRILAMAGNMTELAAKSEVKRPNVYRMLSRNANPGFASLITLTQNMGIGFQFVSKNI